MITNLPIRLAAAGAEPGFSLLARNTEANASHSLANFCFATGLNKSRLCAGDAAQLDALAQLTGSNPADLQRASPKKIDKKFISLNGQRFLTRSIRRADLAICPRCWLEQYSTGERYRCAIRREWLSRPLRTCILHRAALVPLPYEDYTTVFDPMFRSRLETGWMGALESKICNQRPTGFERAAYVQLTNGAPMCGWLPETQIDVLERWSLGLGAFVDAGMRRPDTEDLKTRRKLIDIGYRITRDGLDGIHTEVDAALARHCLKLSDTWLHSWACQSAAPEERREFREIMAGMVQDQGRYCLRSVSPSNPVAAQVEAGLRRLSTKTRRSRHWVRRALIADGLLPASGDPSQGDLTSHFNKCEAHLARVLAGLTTKDSAKRLGMGVRMFEGLVTECVLTPIPSRIFGKPRFDAADLDGLLDAVEAAVTQHDSAPADLIPLSQACFASRCSAGQIFAFLRAGELHRTHMTSGAPTFEGLRISYAELRAAILRRDRHDLTIDDLKRTLSLSAYDIRRLMTSGLLPTYDRPRPGKLLPRAMVAREDFEAFLARYHSCRTAAAHRGIPTSEMRRRILARGLVTAPEGLGAKIYRSEDIDRL